MKISIITICHNNGKDIRLTIESVVNQTYNDIEYIIVDGASSDNTLSIISEYQSHISLLISEPDNGMYEALNKGFRAATGDVIGMIHAGDRLFNNNVISKIADFYNKNDVDLSYGNSLIVDGTGIVRRVNKSPAYDKLLISRGWMPSHQSIYCRKCVFEKVGYYRTDFGGGGDYEWFIRAFYKYSDIIKIKGIDEFIVLFSLGGQSTSNYSRKLKKTYFDFINACWSINGFDAPNLIVLKMFGRKIIQYVRALLWNHKLER